MNKGLMLLVAGWLVLGLNACGGSNGSSGGTESTNDGTTQDDGASSDSNDSGTDAGDNSDDGSDTDNGGDDATDDDPANGDGTDDGSDPAGGDDTGTTDPAPSDDTVTHNLLTDWLFNTSTRSQHIFETGSSTGVLVNVQSATATTVSGRDYVRVQASGIPDYNVTLSSADIAALNSRPRAASDFRTGSTTASPGSTVAFGEDIGYSSNTSCQQNGGYGYWPPGPECPENVSHDSHFPTVPVSGDGSCETGLGAQGYWVNGTSIYQWSDGQTYNNEGVWSTLAPVAEQYDVDICGGHAAQGDYHHHFYSSCLARLVGDTGNGHSPVYGYAADGYPVYGPWHADGVLAKSSWVTRDYSAGSATGCGSNGQRTCVMVDEYDPSKGTTPATAGPTTSQSYTTLSGNTLIASAGSFYEDYYWDSSLAARGGEYLDQFNGHSDAVRGYHYHVTVTEANGSLTPAFPYTIGPRFAGDLASNAMTACGGSQGAPGGGGGNPPPPPGGGNNAPP